MNVGRKVTRAFLFERSTVTVAGMFAQYSVSLSTAHNGSSRSVQAYVGWDRQSRGQLGIANCPNKRHLVPLTEQWVKLIPAKVWTVGSLFPPPRLDVWLFSANSGGHMDCNGPFLSPHPLMTEPMFPPVFSVAAWHLAPVCFEKFQAIQVKKK